MANLLQGFYKAFDDKTYSSVTLKYPKIYLRGMSTKFRSGGPSEVQHLEFIVQNPLVVDAVRARDSRFRMSWDITLAFYEEKGPIEIYEAGKQARAYELEHGCDLSNYLPPKDETPPQFQSLRA